MLLYLTSTIILHPLSKDIGTKFNNIKVIYLKNLRILILKNINKFQTNEILFNYRRAQKV